MRQRLQEHTDRLGDLKLRAKKLSEDVVDQREQLCVKIRTLSVASKALDAAHSNLKVFDYCVLFPFGSLRILSAQNNSATKMHRVLYEVASSIACLTCVICTLKCVAWCFCVHKMLILGQINFPIHSNWILWSCSIPLKSNLTRVFHFSGYRKLINCCQGKMAVGALKIWNRSYG
jgi:hypothetical protein